MRYLLLIIFLLPSCKLIERHNTPDVNNPALLIGNEENRQMPEFGVPTPEGYTKRVLYGVLDPSGVVVVEGLKKGDKLLVTIKDAGHWFKLGTLYSGAYYYQVKIPQVVYIGLNINRKEYCIYHFVKNTP